MSEQPKEQPKEQTQPEQSKEQNSATERRKHIAEIEKKQKVTLSRIAVSSIENVKNNADVGMGSITDVLAGAVCVLFSNGKYGWGLVVFLVYVALCIFKHQVPEGPVTIWLKKPIDQIVKDTEDTIKDLSETFARKRIK